MNPAEKSIYLTFDDGPHPQITPFVLDELKRFEALATFFCIGKNVAQHPDIYQHILAAGHAVGNHTHNHLNGWKTPTATYMRNITEATHFIDSNLFRPPYGRIKKTQAKKVKNALQKADGKIILWDVLSADFDTGISARQCLQNVIQHCTSGSIVVFHDSEKAFPNLKYALPKTLEILSERGYRFQKIVV